jgi:hypothetical protein
VFLCGVIVQLDDHANCTVRSQDHFPRELSDLASSQPGFSREQNEDSIAKGLTGR